MRNLLLILCVITISVFTSCKTEIKTKDQVFERIEKHKNGEISQLKVYENQEE